MVFATLLSIGFCITISQLFGKVELIMSMTLSIAALTSSSVLATIFVSASSIYVEANKTHRILFKLINQKRVTETVHLRLKVNFWRFLTAIKNYVITGNAIDREVVIHANRFQLRTTLYHKPVQICRGNFLVNYWMNVFSFLNVSLDVYDDNGIYFEIHSNRHRFTEFS